MTPDVLRVLKEEQFQFPSSYEIKTFSPGLFLVEPYDPSRWSLTVELIELTGQEIRTRRVFPSFHRENGRKIGQAAAGYVLYVDKEAKGNSCSLRVETYDELTTYDQRYIQGGFKDVLVFDKQTGEVVPIKALPDWKKNFSWGVVLCPVEQGILVVGVDNV